MKEKKISRKSSRTSGSILKSNKNVIPMKKACEQDMVYYGNHCNTKYWVYNDELDCIVHAKIESPYDELAESLKHRAKKEKRKAIGE